jgi:hypothetical protein
MRVYLYLFEDSEGSVVGENCQKFWRKASVREPQLGLEKINLMSDYRGIGIELRCEADSTC